MPTLFKKKYQSASSVEGLVDILNTLPEGTTFHVAVYAYENEEAHELAAQRALNRREGSFNKKVVILDTLSRGAEYPRTLLELADRIDTSLKTTRSYLADLTDRGYVRKERTGKGGKLFFTITPAGVEAYRNLDLREE